MINVVDVEVLELANSTVVDVVSSKKLDYDAVKGIIAQYIGKKNERNTVDSVNILEINNFSQKKYMKDFLAVACIQVAGETRILALQYRKKAALLDITNLLRKTSKSFLNVAKEVFDPQINTKFKTEIGGRTEIKEWMR